MGLNATATSGIRWSPSSLQARRIWRTDKLDTRPFSFLARANSVGETSAS